MKFLNNLFGRKESESHSHMIDGIKLIILPEKATCNRCKKRGCAVLAVNRKSGGLLLTSKCYRCAKYRVLSEREYEKLYTIANERYAGEPLPEADKVTEYVFSVDSL